MLIFNKRGIWLTVCAIGLVANWNVSALPLQPADVSAEPVWMVHVDCDNLRQTSIGQHLLSEWEKPEVQAKLEVFQSLFSFDPRKQLHGLTLYGNSKNPDEGVLLVYADFSSDKLQTTARAAKDHKSSNHNQHTIHSWIDEKKNSKHEGKDRTYAAIHGNRVIFGQREAKVAAALDVLDKAAPSLAAQDALGQFAAVGVPGFLVAATRQLDLSSSDSHARVLKLAKLFRLQVGEVERELRATLNVDAKDEEVAKNMASVGEGLLSLLRLQTEKPVSVKLGQALSLAHEGAAVVVNMKLPADDAIHFIKQHSEKREKKKESN